MHIGHRALPLTVKSMAGRLQLSAQSCFATEGEALRGGGNCTPRGLGSQSGKFANGIQIGKRHENRALERGRARFSLVLLRGLLPFFDNAPVYVKCPMLLQV